MMDEIHKKFLLLIDKIISIEFVIEQYEEGMFKNQVSEDLEQSYKVLEEKKEELNIFLEKYPEYNI